MIRYKGFYYKKVIVRGESVYYVARSYCTCFSAPYISGGFITTEKQCIDYIESLII